ncbi:MAG TPA: hypothetical protein HA306_00590 [Methanosarcina sp.]|nr:hypothetical protein [Methanosarcina sp.]
MVLKKVGVGTLILTMLLVGIALMPVASAEKISEDIDGLETELIVEEPEPIPVDPITEDRPYWYLLIADKNQQKVLFQYIDNCYVSDQEKKDMKKAMKDIWSRYPDQITEEDYPVLESVSDTVGKYLNDKYGGSTEEGVSRLTLSMFNEDSKDHELLVEIYDQNETCIFSEEHFLAHEGQVSSPGIFAKYGTYNYEVTLDGNITETYEFVLDTYYSSTVIAINDSDSGAPISIAVESL